MVYLESSIIRFLLLCAAIIAATSNDVCTSRECEILSGRIYRMMDPTVDPCDDFEQFTCGGYRQYRFSEGKPISFIRDAGDKFKEMAKEMLVTDEPIRRSSKRMQDLYSILRLTYRKCTDVFKEGGGDDLKKLIYEEIERYGASLDPSEKLEKFLGKLLNSAKYTSIVNSTYMYYWLEGSEYKLHVNLLLFSNLSEMQAFALDLLNHGVLKEIAKKSLSFMKSIHTSELRKIGHSSCTYKLSNITSGLSFDFAEFGRYFKQFNNIRKLKNVNVNLSPCIPMIFREYGRNEGFKSYLAIKALHSVLPNLRRTQSNDFCFNELSQGFFLLLSDMFRRNYIKFDDTKETKAIIRKLKNAAVKLALKQPWLDWTSLINYIESVQMLSVTYGYPRAITERVLQKLARSPTTRLKKFQKMSNQDFFKNFMALQDSYSVALLNEIRSEESLLTISEMSGLIHNNAYQDFQAFNVAGTYLLFSLATEFPFILSPTLPEYVKVSAYGFITGHEIGHNIKYGGSHGLQLTDTTLNKLEKKFECIRNVYQEEYAKTLLVDARTALAYANKTINENIADFTADSLFFEAAFGRGSRIQKMRMPGPMSRYTPEQVFFIHRLQPFCSKFMLPKYKKAGPNEFNHSPANMRVNVTSKNSAHFAKAFNCKPGTPMNPIREKCVIF